jgi:predicted NAD/FAD-binding protein
MVVRFRVKETVEEIKRLPAKEGSPETGDRVLLRTREGKEETFDRVVLAGHADESLALLADPSDDESRLLSPWHYQKNQATLHTDPDVMPPLKRAWACWNYVRERDVTRSGPVSLTYHANRLQGLTTPTQYFVTFNRIRPIPQHHILKEIFFTHPTFTRESLNTQEELPNLNGVNNTYFCGSYFGNGFHEDAVKSGVAVAKSFGMDL